MGKWASLLLLAACTGPAETINGVLIERAWLVDHSQDHLDLGVTVEVSACGEGGCSSAATTETVMPMGEFDVLIDEVLPLRLLADGALLTMRLRSDRGIEFECSAIVRGAELDHGWDVPCDPNAPDYPGGVSAVYAPATDGEPTTTTAAGDGSGSVSAVVRLPLRWPA